MTSPKIKIYDFVLRNILRQNKHTKVKKLSSSYKRSGKTEKRQKIVKTHFGVDSCYGNVIHHRHDIAQKIFSDKFKEKSRDLVIIRLAV